MLNYIVNTRCHDCTAQWSNCAVFYLELSSVAKQIKLIPKESRICWRLHPFAFLVAAIHNIFVETEKARGGRGKMAWITASAIGYIALGNSADFSKDLEIYG